VQIIEWGNLCRCCRRKYKREFVRGCKRVQAFCDFMRKPFYAGQSVAVEKSVDWKLSLVIVNGDPNDEEFYQEVGDIEYPDFIARLSKDKYRFIDAKYILVDALTQEEILSILK